MSNRKNYNSIVFLTTLSVYLGLVLVGSPSSVLAQTSLNTENSQIFVGQSLYGNAIDELVRQLETLRKEGKLKADEKIALDYEFSFSESDGSPQYFLSGKVINDHVSSITDLTAEKISRDLSKLENVYFKKSDRLGSFDFTFAIEPKDFLLKVKHNYDWTKDAEAISGIFGKYFEQESVVRKNEPLGKVYENTKVTFENNQVFIVTRLPRASIDSLLAPKDAQ